MAPGSMTPDAHANVALAVARRRAAEHEEMREKVAEETAQINFVTNFEIDCSEVDKLILEDPGPSLPRRERSSSPRKLAEQQMYTQALRRHRQREHAATIKRRNEKLYATLNALKVDASERIQEYSLAVQLAHDPKEVPESTADEAMRVTREGRVELRQIHAKYDHNEHKEEKMKTSDAPIFGCLAPRDRKRLFDFLDRDRDGFISTKEFAQAICMLDSNRDGSVSSSELGELENYLRPLGILKGKEKRAMRRHLLAVLDLDGDGVFDHSDVAAAVVALDKNLDNQISREEAGVPVLGLLGSVGQEREEGTCEEVDVDVGGTEFHGSTDQKPSVGGNDPVIMFPAETCGMHCAEVNQLRKQLYRRMATAAGGKLQLFKDFNPPIHGSSAHRHCAEVSDRVLTYSQFVRGIVRAGIRPKPANHILQAMWRSFPRMAQNVMTTSMIVSSLEHTRNLHNFEHRQKMKLRNRQQAAKNHLRRPSRRRGGYASGNTRSGLRAKRLQKKIFNACFAPPKPENRWRKERGHYLGLQGLREFFFGNSAIEGNGNVLTEEDFIRALCKDVTGHGDNESDLLVATVSEARAVFRSFQNNVRKTLRAGMVVELLDSDVMAALEREFGVPLTQAKAAVRKHRRTKKILAEASLRRAEEERQNEQHGFHWRDNQILKEMPIEVAAAQAEELRRKNALLMYRLGQTG